MSTVTQVTSQPTSGLPHVDALLGVLPGWNWLAPARDTLYFTFSIASGNNPTEGQLLTGGASSMSSVQQTAVLNALTRVGLATGIFFSQTTDGSAADLHFALGDIAAPGTLGVTQMSYQMTTSGDSVVTYSADAWIYLDMADFASINTAPTPGTQGFEGLLHEVLHAVGLKHPFEPPGTLPAAEDNTAYTLMSYTHVGGPYADLRPYDYAALMWLYGGDGLGGALGQNSPGSYLVGTSVADTLTGGAGDDTLQGLDGNDVLDGGAGSDTAVYSGARNEYVVTTTGTVTTVTGIEGADTLRNMEFVRFGNTLLSIGPGNSPPTGPLEIFGTPREGERLQAQNSISDVDGLGTLAFRWQSSPDGTQWTDIAGATRDSFVPLQPQVGLRLRVVASFVDGKGHPETVFSAATPTVINVNSAPVGTLRITGTAVQGQTLALVDSVVDEDGRTGGALQWQSSPDGRTWTDVAGARSETLPLDQSLVGKQVRVRLSFTDGGGTAESVTSEPSVVVINVNDAPTGGVTVSGTPMQGRLLTAANTLADGDGLGTVNYQWQVSTGFLQFEDIAGATGSSFTPGQDVVGRFVRVVAGYVDGGGTRESMASGITPEPVANVNDPPIGTVTVTGTPRAGQPLAATATLSDLDGLGTIRFEWQSSSDGSTWVGVAGATQSTFTPPSALAGLRVRAVAQYVDGFGASESVPSAALALRLPVEGGAGADNLVGSDGDDEINGLAGNDRLRGGGGDDILNGGSGIDTAVYARARADYRVGAGGSSVRATAGTEGSDTLQQIERLAFSDESLAFDLDAQAGTVARILGAVFGPASVGNKVYVGIGLQQLGLGLSANELMQLALNARLGTGFGTADEVRLFFQNLAGVAPTADELAFWVGTVTSGQFTQLSLAMTAANAELTAQAVDLVGLSTGGLPYVPA